MNKFLLHDGVEIDFIKRVAEKNGVRIHLTNLSWYILEFMSLTPNIPIPTEKIIKNVNPDMSINAFRVSISSIRKSLGNNIIVRCGRGHKKIVTVSGRSTNEEILERLKAIEGMLKNL